MGKRWLAPTGLVVAALMLAACGSSSSSTTPGSGTASSGNALKTATIGGATVLTNAKGFTLYWFAKDTSSKSNCTGACASLWPAVPGPATAGAGVTASMLGVITGSNGSKQATYNGHPLYTYSGDSAPGQNNGNGFQGVWHEVTVSGAAPQPTKSSSGGGGGYGY